METPNSIIRCARRNPLTGDNSSLLSHPVLRSSSCGGGERTLKVLLLLLLGGGYLPVVWCGVGNVTMIIKGLFKRYQRWNPVHPTAGAFWGMGLGVGCGIGWGPGFGPEVIGYVGAGCGVGFSVGFTFAGVGVGLPANALFRIPRNVFVTSTGAFIFAKSTTLPVLKCVSGDGWNYISHHASSLRNVASQNFSNFKSNFDQAKSVRWSEVHKILSCHAQGFGACIEEFKNHHFPKKDR